MTTLHEKILNEFLDSNVKIKSLDKLNDYISFCINNNQKEFTKGKTSLHHILPKAKDCFPQYKDLKTNKWNGAHLLHSDHYYAHWLMIEALNISSQLFAFCAMHNKDIKLGRITEEDLIPADEFQKKMEERSMIQSKMWNEIQDNGLTVSQNASIKGAETMSKIQENGLAQAQNMGLKSAQTKNKIQDNGLSIAQNAGLKISKLLKEKSIINFGLFDVYKDKSLIYIAI